MNLGKIAIIAKREYITRVRKKTFLISTLLTPLAVIGLFVLSTFLGSANITKPKKILIVDESGLIKNNLKNDYSNQYTHTTKSFEDVREDYQETGYDILVQIVPQDTTRIIENAYINLFSDKKPGFIPLESIEGSIEDELRKFNISISGFTEDQIRRLKPKININSNIGDNSEESSYTESAAITGTILGYAVAFMMYIIFIAYGGMVMRSVMEEKINRIVEVVISSVKPMELMLGKIIGVSLVGLTQLIFWIILIAIGYTITLSFYGIGDFDSAQIDQAMATLPAGTNEKVIEILINIGELNWLVIIPSLIIFFLGGFLIYSALFAAVGSAIGDDMSEGQSLTFPIMVPIIASIILVIPMIQNPHGPISVFATMFPLTSPILMPSRMAFDPPLWQLIVSVIILIVSTLFFVWMSAKIYQTGILLYGKKLSFKNLAQILRSK